MKRLLVLSAAALAAAALLVTGLGLGATGSSSVKLSGKLDAKQETPAPKGAARAAGLFTASLSGRSLTWRLTFSRLTGKAAAAHIHLGKLGVAGPVVVPLCGPCASGVHGKVVVPPKVVSGLNAGTAYVNVHTARNPGGEIRAQLGLVLSTKLDAQHETPAPKDAGQASGVFTSTLSGTALDWRLTFSGLTGQAMAAHIHTGKPGVAGPVVVPLCGPCSSGAHGEATVSAKLRAAMLAGTAYVNVHTAENPGGEIRGQFAGVNTEAPPAPPPATTTTATDTTGGYG
jgi:CHRD domain-containing protein